jgi:hypothetical protein
MQPITRAEVRSLEAYELARADFRQHIRGVCSRLARGGRGAWRRYQG